MCQSRLMIMGSSHSVFCHFRLAGIMIEQRAPRKITRLSRMLLDLVEWACENPPGKFLYPHEINLLVISKDIPGEDTEFVNVLEELQRRNFNVFLVVPDDCPPEQVPLPSTASLVWRWTNLFDGKFPIISDSDDEDESDSSDEDESVTPSFKKKESVTPTDADPVESRRSHRSSLVPKPCRFRPFVAIKVRSDASPSR